MDPFAKTLAAGIRSLKAPEGTVIALNGPWGSGKSSAVNLILYHLKEAIAANEIAVVNFACWWFRGEEALALAFSANCMRGLGHRWVSVSSARCRNSARDCWARGRWSARGPIWRGRPLALAPSRRAR